MITETTVKRQQDIMQSWEHESEGIPPSAVPSPIFRGMNMAKLKVDRYEMEFDPKTRTVRHFAICGKKRIEMPSHFADMYTDDYLLIESAHSDMPEVLDLPSADYWSPRRTAP